MTWKVPVKYTITVTETVIVEAQDRHDAIAKAEASVFDRRMDKEVDIDECHYIDYPRICGVQ